MNRFIGREKELAELKSLWNIAREGMPQVVNFIADTGVGKTRLIQAFYEWLSTDPEQGDGTGKQGYWPDDLGTARQRVVNPPLERFESFNLKTDRIPWLWWGMYWTDAANDVQTALSDFSVYLDVHLKMLEVNRDCDSSATKEVMDVVIDHLKDEAASQLPVINLIWSAGKLTKALIHNSKERKAASLGPGERQQGQLEALADELLLRMQKMFDSSAPTPMVLFLDDIHFATDISRDELTLQFLDRLLRQAALNAWPLLVITTHWKAPWQAHLKTTSENGKPWRRIEEALKDDFSIKDKLSFHDCFLEKMTHGDLHRIAIDYLPGLSEENIVQILSRVDNVRWLVELLKALMGCLENFEVKQRDQELSPTGKGRLEKLLLQQGYLGVLRERLMGDEMSDIRVVLGATAWHTYGLDFVSPLAEAFEQRLIEQNLLSAGDADAGPRVFSILMQALDPASLIEGDVRNGQLSNLIWFPERGYLEVARELFDESLTQDLSPTLGRRVVEWMQQQGDALPCWQQLESLKERKVFLGIATEVLGKLQPRLLPEQQQILEIKEEAWRDLVKDGTLTEKQFNDKSQKAREDLLQESAGFFLEGAIQYQALAMAELVPILMAEGQAQAWELAYALTKHPGFQLVREFVSHSVRMSLVSCWRENTQCWQAARDWIDADLNCRAPKNRSEIEIEERCDSLVQSAYLDLKTDSTNLARQRLDEAQWLLSFDVRQSPEQLQKMSVVVALLSQVDQKEGDQPTSIWRLGECLKLQEKLLTECGEKPQLLRDISITLNSLGKRACRFDLFDEARDRYEKSLSIREQLLATYGETPQRLRDRSVSLELLSDLEWSQRRDIACCIRRLEESLSIRERLLTEFGETSERLMDKSVTLKRFGYAEKNNKNFSGAQQYFETSLALLERILNEYGQTAERLQRIVDIRENLADISSGDIAINQLRKCLEIWDKRQAEFGVSPACSADQYERKIRTLVKLARLEKSLGNRDRAKECFEASLAEVKYFYKKFGATPPVVNLQTDIELGLKELK